jgi:opacity protein-like surface antigen
LNNEYFNEYLGIGLAYVLINWKKMNVPGGSENPCQDKNEHEDST